jgi:dihydroxyacetone kinase-like protein
MLGQVLLAEIGGAMGPLYGSFFIDMGTACGNSPAIDKEVFGKMLKAGMAAMQDLGGAKVGDKTMMDALVPAVEEYEKAVSEGVSFSEALNRMRGAAVKGGHPRNDRKTGTRQSSWRTLTGNLGCGRNLLLAHTQIFL